MTRRIDDGVRQRNKLEHLHTRELGHRHSTSTIYRLNSRMSENRRQSELRTCRLVLVTLISNISRRS